jgi:hypothetical protein
MLMESAQLSNVELLIILYAYIGAWRCMTSSAPSSGLALWATTFPIAVVVVSMLLPLWATFHCWLCIESTVPRHAILLLSYVADSIFLLLRWTLRYCVRGIWLLSGPRVKASSVLAWRLLWLFVVTACGAQLVYSILTPAFAGTGERQRQFELLDGRSLLALTSFVFSPVLALALTAGLSRQSVHKGVVDDSAPLMDRYINAVAWTLPLVPLLSVGEVYYIFVRGKASSTSGAALIWTVAPVALRFILGFLDVTTNPADVRMRAGGLVAQSRAALFTILLQNVRFLFLVLVASPLIFKSGGSFYICHVLVAMSGIDIVEIMVRLLAARANVVEKKE